MVDLHSHVLFGMDDGARTIDESFEILTAATAAGIDKMAATPHFTVGEDVELFLKARDERLRALEEEAKNIGIELVGGAEVYVNDALFDEENLDRLTIGNGPVMLTEFKYHALSGGELTEYLDEIRSRKIIPLVAHPERYSYLRREPQLVNSLILRGAFLQVNAESLFKDDEEGEFARMLVRRKAASAAGSDVHRAGSARMRAMGMLKNENEAARAIFEGSDDIYKIEPELI